MQSIGDIWEGQKFREQYKVSNEIHSAFLTLFEDTNPLHHDLEYATQCGFEQAVMHGAILNGFLSHFIGMVAPGNGSLILSVHINYLKPTFLNDTIELEATVIHKLDSRNVVEMVVTFNSINRTVSVAKAKVTVAMVGVETK
jgi:acyl dehydratase